MQRGASVVPLAVQEEEQRRVTALGFEERYTGSVSQVKNPAVLEFLSVPAGDVSVTREELPLRTTEPTIPPEERSGEQPNHIKDAVYAFSKSIAQVSFNFRDLGSEQQLVAPSQKLPLHHYERDHADNGSSSVSLDKELLEPYSTEIYKAEYACRVDRFPLMALTEITKLPAPLSTKPEVPVHTSYVDSQMLVRCLEMNFPIGEMEPFFFSMALYDVVKKQRLTEDFNLSLAEAAMLRRLEGRTTPEHAMTLGNSALFRISEPSADVQLVVRVHKVLMGDESTAVGLYLKPAVKPKEKTKYAATASTHFSRVGAFTQTFAIALVPLFTSSGQPMYTQSTHIDVKRMVRMNGDFSDESLFRNLKPLMSEKGPAKLKLFPGKLVLQIGPPTPETTGVLTPSLVPVAPQPSTLMDSDVIREIQEFLLDDTGVAPQMEWLHHLYVYPLSVNMSNWSGKGKARNLCVDVYFKDTDTSELTGLPRFYGHGAEADMVTSVSTVSSYHDPKPNFSVEAKLKLPGSIQKGHNLLFVVNHVQVTPKSKKDKGETVKTPIAYAILPLIDKNGKFIADGEHFLSCIYGLPEAYMNQSAEDTFKLVDKNRKPNLIVRTKLVSTIQSQDEQLSEFFTQLDAGQDIAKLWTSMNALRTLSPPLAVKWFPTLFTSFFKILCNMKTNASLAAYQAMVFVTDSLGFAGGDSESNQLVQWYLQYRFDVVKGTRLLHEALVSTMGDVLQQKNSEVTEMVCKHSDFLFGLILKSMALYLAEQQQLSESVPRSVRFPPEFAHQVARLMAFILDEMIAKPVIARTVNKAAARLLVGLMSLMDRGVVMDLMYLYCTKMPDNLLDLRFAFLTEVAMYEHYIQVNLPLPDKIEDLPNMERNLWEKHFLAGLVCYEVCRVLEQGSVAPSNLAIKLLFNLFIKHEADPRYQSVLAQKCIAGIYFPFLVRMADIQTEHPTLISDAPYEVRKKILTCFLWVVKNVQRKMLQQWWLQDSQRRIISFFVILANCLVTFEYRASYKDLEGKDSELLKSRGTAVRDLSSDPMGTLRRGTNTPVLMRKQSTKVDLDDETSKQRAKEMNLSREVGLIVIDLLMDFMNDFADELVTPKNVFMDRIVISIPLILIRKPQCQAVMCSALAMLRHVICMFPDPLFKDLTPFCGDIAYELMRHCNSSDELIRSKVCSLLYLMLQQNSLKCGNISRMKLQSTIGVNKLVGEGLTQQPARFNACLKEVAKHAVGDSSMNKKFKTQVVDLAKRLLTVLSNSTMINKFSYDPEMTADLYYEISKGYLASPDLRAAWLQSLGKLHLTHENYEEFAQCKIHLASLISVYINAIKPAERVKINPVQFQRAAPNSHAEMDVPKEALEEEGICETATFTRAGLFTQLADAVEFLEKDSLFESCIAVERLMVDIHKENRSFAEISKVFKALENLCVEIINANATNSRLFSQYYLVGFYGEPFAEQSGTQYIYKERPHVRVAEFTNRLEAQYQEKFGSCTIIKGVLNKESLDMKKANVRILSIKPYLSKEELHARSSPFERQFNISRFIYETPMTTTGKKYSEDMTEQQKKKTILTTEHAFPYVIKRLKVVKEEHHMLSPIQTSTEIIEDRCEALRLEITATPPNSKTLQIVLQGSVLLQVNAGPLAIGRTFLGEKEKYEKADIERLESFMAEFVDLCGQALKVNKVIIDASQALFHQEMEKGYEQVRSVIDELLA